MGFGPLPGGLKPWNSAQTLFDGANLYYSDGTTFVDSSGNVTLTAGTIDGMVIGGSTPEAGTFTTVTVDSGSQGSSSIIIGTGVGIYSSINTFLIETGGSQSLHLSQGQMVLGQWGNRASVLGPSAGFGNVDRDADDIIFASGQSTGAGAAGNIIFQVSLPGSSGGALNSYSDIAKLTPNGWISTLFANQSTPSTPTGGFVFYSISGQPHTLDVNAKDINLSLCPQPDTGWAMNSAVGNKATSLPVYIATSTILNTTDPGSAQQIQALTDKVAALQLQASLGLYANA